MEIHIGHDYAHCIGEQQRDGKTIVCPKRQRCMRYQLHLDAVQKQLDYPICYISSDNIDCDCEGFWDVNDTK